MGAPACGYPWHWSVYRWLEGDSSSRGRIEDLCGNEATVMAIVRDNRRILAPPRSARLQADDLLLFVGGVLEVAARGISNACFAGFTRRRLRPLDAQITTSAERYERDGWISRGIDGCPTL